MVGINVQLYCLVLKSWWISESLCILPPQGGIAFVLIKGVLKVYFKQQQYIIQANRHILNYPERSEGEQAEAREEDTEDSGNE